MHIGNAQPLKAKGLGSLRPGKQPSSRQRMIMFLVDFAFYAENHCSITGMIYVKGEGEPLLAGSARAQEIPENSLRDYMKLSTEELQRRVSGNPAFVLTKVGDVIDYELAYY